ncbi:MAG: RNA polymerase sigma factor [bacterium]|jgi:RNA polymerase sigma-70 factor (ECF subfamily)
MIEDKELTDEEVVEKVRSSDKDLYVLIIERYQNKLLRYANNLLKDEDKAVDIVQASFIKTFVNLNNFDTKKKFSSWIYRIVHNEALNLIKKYPGETPLLDDLDFKSDENVEEDFIQKETKAQVEKCLKEIPILYSEPLSLYYIDNKSYEEISDILRIPMGTVAIRISRAKKLMKNICQKI